MEQHESFYVDINLLVLGLWSKVEDLVGLPHRRETGVAGPHLELPADGGCQLEAEAIDADTEAKGEVIEILR